MIVKEYSFFEFAFKGNLSKTQSYERLNDFLKSNDWIDSMERMRIPLKSYHSEYNGHCFITLEEETVTEDFVDLTNELYYDLVDEKNCRLD